MITIEQSVVINRPIEEVFEFVADQSKLPLWQSGVLESGVTSEGPMGVGTTYRYTFQLLGRKVETAGEITEYELNSRCSFKAQSGPFPLKGGFSFRAVNGGTRVTLAVEAEAAGFFKLAEPIGARMLNRQFETNFGNLKDLLEAETRGNS